VETAIVMPLFVFLILGILQLALMHQARSMVKYAAFKAARAGILHHADTHNDGSNTMEMAALAVLLPVISQNVGGPEGGEVIHRTRTSTDYGQKMGQQHFQNNQFPEANLKYVQVDICAPLQDQAQAHANAITPNGHLSFDWPMDAGVGWQAFSASKLAVQVTLNYRMMIPFADMVLWYMFREPVDAQQQRDVLYRDVLRMNGEKEPQQNVDETIRQLASQRIYVVPIRANYALRMQSDLVVSRLPTQNRCVFPRDVAPNASQNGN